MVDAYLAYFFQTLGTALVLCTLCWFALPKAGLTSAAKRLLFAKLLGVFMVLHFASLVLYPEGANAAITAFAAYAIARWVLMPKQPAE